ncbi:hypothetical protein FH972_000788 [Carpinus fangiana]|uniref:Uncharacterized protein n=1 Tax=Carpinus fangiana TaxID=176857 RepID=A0A5N6QBL2_9ROSI|nr:hypothetical protein FH972_000788 [Carpinus fangiana]
MFIEDISDYEVSNIMVHSTSLSEATSSIGSESVENQGGSRTPESWSLVKGNGAGGMLTSSRVWPSVGVTSWWRLDFTETLLGVHIDRGHGL